MMRAFAILFLLASVLASTGSEGGARELVGFDPSARPGAIVVKTSERRLYLTLGGGQAIRYTVGVGRRGKQWTGVTRVVRMQLNPSFAPPADVKRDNPSIPDVIPPGPRNPLGPAALVLAHNQYAIHGTNRPDSVGGFVSYGCIRMRNRDILDLYARVRVGTPVYVLP